MLDRIVKMSSLAGATLIFFGVLKLIFFYDAYDIKIVEFLNFSEIITSFLDDVNLLLIFFLIMIVQSVPILSLLHKRSGLPSDKFYEGLFTAIYNKRFFLIGIYTLLMLMLIALVYVDVVNLNYYVIYGLIFCVLQIGTLIMVTLGNNEKPISGEGVVLVFFVTMSCAIFLLAKHDVIESEKNPDTVVLYLKGEMIECGKGSKFCYLGKTENYLFIRAKDATICLPILEVERIDFK